MFNHRFAAGLLALATTTAIGVPAVAAPRSDRYYQMQVVHSGLRLEVAFGATGPGAPIIQGPSGPSYIPSHWQFQPVDNGFFRIRNRNSADKCLISNGSVRQVIRQNVCNFAQQQFVRWKLTQLVGTNTYKITAQSGGLALCIIGDLTFGGVPLVSDADNGVSCDQRIQLIDVGPV